MPDPNPSTATRAARVDASAGVAPRPGGRAAALLLPCAFLVATVALRLPVLLAHVGTHYPYEVFSGTVATALLDGLDLDVARLTIIDHVRGGPLFGVLLVPFFALLGPTALALKLLPLLWHAVTVALAVALLRRVSGRGAAVAAGLLLLAAPPLVAKLSVLGFASHLESTLVGVATLFPCVALVRSTAAPRRAAAPAFALGLLVGLGAFFHLQALLAGLLALLLVALAAPRRLLRGGPALAGGLLLGAAPLLLFPGGDTQLLGAVLAAEQDGHVTPRQGFGVAHAASHHGVANKLAALLREGPGAVLEYGQLGPHAGQTAGRVAGLLLCAAAGAALWRARRGLVALLRRGARPDGHALLVLFFALHAGAVLAMLVISGMALNTGFVGSGMEGRRLAPAVFSLLVLAGLGLAPPRGRRARQLAAGALAVLVGLGLAGHVAASSASEGERRMTRGERYEWVFLRHLERHAGGRLDVLADTLARIDRGDRRFVSLRFLPTVPVAPGTSLREGLGAALAPVNRPELRLLLVTGLGRALGQRAAGVAGLASGDDAAGLADLPPLLRAALLHGVGLGAARLVPPTPEPSQELLALCRALPAPDTELVLEGYGFAQGVLHNPFNAFHEQRLAGFATLPEPARTALLRGFGWGYRQRWTDPPTTPLHGLRVLALLPEHCRPALEEGLYARSLPAEAAALEEVLASESAAR